jgi:hypothetical protein
MKMVKLARPVLTFCVAIVAAFFSNSLSLVAQSDAAPMFPAELKQATQDVAIGQIEVARRAGQAKRQFEQRRQRQSQANNYGTSRQQSVLVGSESSPNERNKLVSSRQPIQSVSTGSMQTGESHRNPTDEGWFGTVMTIPDGKTCSGAKVVVHPPVSNGTNQYTFIVENLGAGSSEPFTVDFTTSNDVRVLQVFPFSASTSEHSVSVKFDGLGAYAQSKIHIKTTSATKGKFDFQAKVRMEKVQAFRVATTPSKTQEEPVSSNTSLASNSTTGNSSVSETPATNSAASVTSDERYKLASTAQQRKPVTEPTVSESEIEIAESDQNSHAATSDEKYLLTTSLAGPKALVPNQEYDFEIFASNTMASDSTEIIIQLNLPSGLMITNLDRQAWINQEQRTVSWQIPSLASGATETIRYRVKTTDEGGGQLQSLVVGMNNRVEGHVELKSVISTIENKGEDSNDQAVYSN